MILLLQVFKNPKPALLAILKESGPVPGDANGVKAREESAKKKKRPDKGVSLSKHSHIYPNFDADRAFWIQIDMEKLAENMQKMTEDDLLLVVQMIHDNKTADTWTKNDVDRKYWIRCRLSVPRLISSRRGRVSSGSLHPSRQFDTPALGLHKRENRSIATRPFQRLIDV